MASHGQETITLHRYFNGEAITLALKNIKSMQRFTADDDAKWGHPGPQPFTMITLKDSAVTSDGVGTAYVRETPEEIRDMAAVLNCHI